MSVVGWCALLAVVRAEEVVASWETDEKKFLEDGQKKIECWQGMVGPCESGVSKAESRSLVCARRVYGNKEGRAPSFRARILQLDQCGTSWNQDVYDGCTDDSPSEESLFHHTTVLQRAVKFLDSQKMKGQEGAGDTEELKKNLSGIHIDYLCAHSEQSGTKNLGYPTSEAYEDQEYTTTVCICNRAPMCNELPLTGRSFNWTEDFSRYFDEDDSTDADAIEKIRKEIQPMDFAPEASYEFPKSYPLRSREGACHFDVSLEFLNCRKGKKPNTDFLVAAFKQALAETKEECLEAPWCWRLQGEIRTNLSGVLYHLQLDLAACPSLLQNDSHPWTFLSHPDFNAQVSTPCNRLQPGEKETLRIHHGVPLRLQALEFEPTDKLRLTCSHPQENSQSDMLQELKHNLWVAVIVALLQVTLCGLLLLGAVLRMEEPREFISFYLKLMYRKLEPFYCLFAIPDHLVEGYLELNNLLGIADEFRDVRDAITDHQRLSTYNFFGWRTDFDYRLLPCFGKPPEVPKEESKCTCMECKHIPGINLTKFISPARLIAMGLKERAMVDRADPLYETFVGLRTEDQLPLDFNPARLPSVSSPAQSNVTSRTPSATPLARTANPHTSRTQSTEKKLRRSKPCSKFSPNRK